MIACAWLPHFALRVLCHQRVDLSGPVAVVSARDTHPRVLDCTAPARAEGVGPGMLCSRALGCCVGLEVLDYDDELVAAAGERFVMRLEALGAAVQPMEPGRAFFDAGPLDLLYGGMAGVASHIHGAYRGGELRLGMGPNPFVAWVAARHAQAGKWLAVEGEEAPRMLADMPLSLLPADERMLTLLDALGLRTLGEFASIDVAHVADRFGEQGVTLHALARGSDPRPLRPRRPLEPVVETLQFPEPVASIPTLQRALAMLIDRAVASPRCVQFAPRAIVVVASLVSSGSSAAGASGSHRVRRVLRVPTVDAARILLTAQVGLEDVPAPVERLTVRLEEFELRDAEQQDLLAARGANALTGGDGGSRASGIDDVRVQAGLRQVRAALGEEAILQVLEVEPDSRVPERHAVLVPRHAAAADAGSSSGAPGALRGITE